MVKLIKTAAARGLAALPQRRFGGHAGRVTLPAAARGRRALPLRRIRTAAFSLVLAAMAMTAMADPKTVYYTLPDGVPDDGMTPVQRLTTPSRMQ